MLGRCKYKRDNSTMQENKQEKSPIKRKILLFLSENGISQYDFYRKTGITRGILGQNNGISEDNMARFLAAYPQVSVEWLLTGRGSMLRDQDPTCHACRKRTIPSANGSQSRIAKHPPL